MTLEEALDDLESREIADRNTPVFFRHALQTEPLERTGTGPLLEKLLAWWRSDIWIPPEQCLPRVPCPLCQVHNDPDRSIPLENYLTEAGLTEIACGYRLIVNNKWVFPHHFLVLSSRCATRSAGQGHVVTPERIRIMSALAEQLPTHMLYATSRGVGIPHHFHAHIVCANEYKPPLVREADKYVGELFELTGSPECQVSEIRGFPSTECEIAGWTVTGSPSATAASVVEIGSACTEVLGDDRGRLEIDVFWGPASPNAIRTTFCFPRTKDAGPNRKLGTAEFMGLFVFNDRLYFKYLADNAEADLSAAGLPWSDDRSKRISNKVQELSVTQ